MDTDNKIKTIAMRVAYAVWACVLRLWRSLKLLLNAASAYRHPGPCHGRHRIAELNVLSKDIEVICEAPTSGTAPPYQGRVTAVQNFRVTYGTDQADRAGLPAVMLPAASVFPVKVTSCEPLGEPVIVATDTRWRGNGGMALLTSLLGRLKDEARRLAEMDEQTKDLARMRLRDLLGRA